ncbi:type II toxin-antitoxin system RelE/ParE family toxin [Desulfovibrio sp.]|uniref:type II toxin-antitoxin system RelE/ParE family toxin n=1 Tax=Desulfovibrio sp. TaxID=885 RepID=UPI0023C79F78|nr:type II toxin-antitoxin system RelE/ParE family toxin [Desulfovibrio sp.]
MKLAWTTHATRRRREIFLYITEDNPEAAGALDKAFEDAASQILLFPNKGRNARAIGTMELVRRTRYLLVYRIVRSFDSRLRGAYCLLSGGSHAPRRCFHRRDDTRHA